ncbi:hypothetical protein [Rugamonas sp. DEMB1]|uniref:hypothetical protein n=1 Tax=Rugamonas sp. DEMB1 TaxID=3039386 RepID=UPI0024469F24|nr:hypothetical protein [Rugamonas sp. DEMB1]WGG49881.1 hypothetical protein QC826_25915 [Rugamonas sp. DEMB1]
MAAQDQEIVGSMLEWNKYIFNLPSNLALDPPLRQAANQIAQEHLARVRTLAPVWIAQERAVAGNPGLLSRAPSQSLNFRSINELAIWSVESGGPAQDEAWLKAALAPASCNAPSSAYFAQRIAMIQAAPLDSRPALLAGERELLSRWGTKRQHLPPRPTTQELDAADHAIARMRAGLPVVAEPMAPALARRLFDRDRKPGQSTGSNRWHKCAKSQWWLASQLASGKIDKMTALTLYRYSTMADARDYAPASVVQEGATARPNEEQPAYPPVAALFNVEGSTTVEAHTDDQGKFLKAQVVSRKITVPGVYDNAPIAFESLLDAASLDYAEKRKKYPPGNNSTVRFELQWHLSEDENEVH